MNVIRVVLVVTITLALCGPASATNWGHTANNPTVSTGPNGEYCVTFRAVIQGPCSWVSGLAQPAANVNASGQGRARLTIDGGETVVDVYDDPEVGPLVPAGSGLCSKSWKYTFCFDPTPTSPDTLSMTFNLPIPQGCGGGSNTVTRTFSFP